MHKPVVFGKGQWSSGYDVALTTRRSPVQFRPGPLKNERIVLMSEKILFSLKNCVKCMQTKELMSDRNDIKIVTYPHEISDWSNEQLNEAKSHDVYQDLSVTAPILWVDSQKIIGYLRIRKWLQDNKIKKDSF